MSYPPINVAEGSCSWTSTRSGTVVVTDHNTLSVSYTDHRMGTLGTCGAQPDSCELTMQFNLIYRGP